MPLPDSLRRILDQKNNTRSVGYVHYTMRDGTSVREYDNGKTVQWPSVGALPQPNFDHHPDFDPFPK